MRKFQEELKELMKKHNVTIESVDNYDNDEEITGTTFYFQIGKPSVLCDENNYSLPLEDIYD